MSDLEMCWELNCIKALSLPELQTNWIKLEKQLPMCTDPSVVFFLFLSLPQIHFWGGEMLAVFSTALVFCPCQHSPNEIPQKSGGEGSTHAPVH